ncbi:MAG: hypothetical protein ACRC7S_18635 [Cetobacterium sp.]
MKAIINLDIVKYPDVVTAKNGADILENGAFVALGALENTGRGRDTYAIGKVAEGCRLGYVADVALMYDETKDERDFEVAAGAITRVYRPRKGDAITIAVKHVDDTVAVGDELEVKSTSYQLQKKASGTGVAVVLEKYNFNGQDSLYIEFI